MSETEVYSISAPQDLMDRVETVSGNRSEAVREALENYLQANSSGEQRIEQIEEEIAEIEAEQEQLEKRKQGLLAEREQIQAEIEREEEEQEAYEKLVDELAELKANGGRVLESSKFKRAVSLCEWQGELAVEKVLEEVRDRAGVQDTQTDTEVITETTDDYDFELNTGDDK
ncbi:hypothetical protein [Halorubrum vacuolatum]|uniref:Ribbon-helix-helix protein, copG family n=1 Tax=Halorubrum vacuolatum TaxID=63740 RepID=A0A238WT08_HALVU|nr:hypothetical protein [Halorubrum vacuolatum]SNR49687.1 hypothetical protein SAMN06264855_11011 [Halorubrum vacuolatum]